MPGRRPLLAFVALFAALLSACIHISAPVSAPDESAKSSPRSDSAPQPPRMEFAVLPKVPGAVVPTKSAAIPPNPTTTVVQNPSAPAQIAPKPVETVPVRPAANGVNEPAPLPFASVAPPLEPPLLAVVRAYTEGRVERSEIIRTLDKPNQDLVLALLPILARGTGTDLGKDPATVAALVEQLHALAARLEPAAALRIDKVAFCKEVSGFGRFVPWPENQPYRPNAQAQLYLEVRNIGSLPASDGYITQVHASVEIRDAYGKLVEQIDPEDYRRRVSVVKFEKRLPSHSPLHDFHVLYVFSAPSAPGVYTVTVEVRDAAGRRTVRTPPAQFCVAGP
jgi:hypothetical protein